MSKEIKKPETEVERHGVCDHKIKELREELKYSNSRDRDSLDARGRTITSLKTEIESLRNSRQYAIRYLGKIKTLQRQIEKLEGVIEECPPCRDKIVRDLENERFPPLPWSVK